MKQKYVILAVAMTLAAALAGCSSDQAAATDPMRSAAPSATQPADSAPVHSDSVEPLPDRDPDSTHNNAADRDAEDGLLDDAGDVTDDLVEGAGRAARNAGNAIGNATNEIGRSVR